MKVTFSDNSMSAQEFVVDIVPGACCSCSSGCSSCSCSTCSC